MITSKSNDLIKHIKLLHQKKYREEYGEFFVEGIKLVKEAIGEKMPITKIIVCEEILKERVEIGSYDVEYVNSNIFEYICDTKTPQGILAVIRSGDLWSPNSSQPMPRIIFALDNIQDPGNLGTIIRTLDCVGINNLLLSKGTVDLFNPKVIRSTMGAIFRVNIQYDLNLKDKLIELKKQGYKIVITDLTASKFHNEISYKEKMVIVIGNESNGVGDEIKELADIKIKIPMLGRTESLNAAVAASVIAYETIR